MDDSDLIAFIYPCFNGEHPDVAHEAFRSSPSYIPSGWSGRRIPLDPPDREPTEPPEDRSGLPSHGNRARIDARFSNIPRTRHGLIFGRDPNSDVVLPDLPGIGYHHFTLTFDTFRRLIVKDWGSRWGTQVTYDGQGEGTRRDFQWIIRDGKPMVGKKTILITVKDGIQFHVVPVPHTIESPQYINSVDLFCRGRATATDLFGNLDLPRAPETEPPTGAQTPSTTPIYLENELGRGGFASVTHFWNVSTGKEFALKRPLAEYSENAWKKEASIMKAVSHISMRSHLFILPTDPSARKISSSFSTPSSIPPPSYTLNMHPWGPCVTLAAYLRTSVYLFLTSVSQP